MALSAGLIGPVIAAVLIGLPRPTAPVAYAGADSRILEQGWKRLTAPRAPDDSPPWPAEIEIDRWERPPDTIKTGRLHSPVPARPGALDELDRAMDPDRTRTYITHGRKGEIQASESHVIRFSEQEMLEAGGLRKVRRFWFDVAGRTYSGSAVAKAALAVEAPLGTRFMTIHAVESQCGTSCDSTRVLLDRFMTVGY